MTNKWAKWLPRPCRIGDPHRFTAGGKIRSGTQVGKMATSPLPYRGSPPLHSRGQNQKWHTSGQSGYLTPAVPGIPTASQRGPKSEVAHKWAKRLPHPCRIEDPHRFTAGGKIRSGPQVGKMATSPLPYRGSPPLQSRGAKSEVAHKWAKWLPHPCRIRDPHRFRAGGKIRSGPQVGKMATSPLPYRGSPPLQSRGGKSEVAHKWAKWLPHPCRIGDPHRFRAGGKIRSGPQVGKVATSPLPSRGSPPLHSGGQNQKWPTSGQNGYLTPAVSGIPTALEHRSKIRSGPLNGQKGYLTAAVSAIPTASEQGGKIRSGPLVGKLATSPLPYRGSPPVQSTGAKTEVAHKWAKWLPHPCRIGDPHRFRAGGKIRSGPQVGKMATSPLPYRGSPALHSGGAKSEVANKWAKWLPHPCRIGDPHRFRAGGKIRSGPQEGKMATSPMPYRGSPPLQSTGAKSEVAHLWAKWLPHPCRIEDPHRFTAGGKIRSGPLVGKMATSPLPYRGSPPLQSGGQNQKWPTYGQNGYLTPAVSGIPTASEQGSKIRSGQQVGKMATSPLPYRGSPPLHSGGAKSEVANKWAKWLPHPCRIGDPHRFRAGGKIRSGPQVGKMATSPMPYRGSPPLQSGGQNQKWPTRGENGYLTHAVSRIPTASEHGSKIRSGPLVGKMATSPLPYRGSPPLHSGGQNQKWPTCGQNGYLTLAVSGIPTASERGAKSEVAHLWAKWLPHPCRIGDPHHFTAGGQNQKWPTSGQNGYLTPAVSGIPTASERGAKSEVAHKWAKRLPHPCRIGDPHRSTAGGKIRSGPQVGKMATSPLPYRGSPPLQSGGQNQKWPTSGQNGYLTPAVSGIPTASQRGAKSEVAHRWAKWLPHPCRIGDPHRFRARGQNQKWPTCGQNGYLTPAVSGIPTTSEQGAKSEVAHKWAKWLPHPCRIGDPHRFTAGAKIRSGPLVGKMATSPLPSRGSPPLQSGGQNQKWPTSGQNGYLAPAVSGIPTASQRGAKSEVAHRWAKWLPHPCRVGDPHHFRAGGKIRSGPQVGKVATSPLPYRGSPPLHSGGQNQKWPTCGQNGYLTPAVSGIPTASERGAKSEVAHLWAKWLPHPCRIGIPTASERGAKSEVAHKRAKWLPHPCRVGDPHHFRAGGKIRSGPQVGKVATSPLPYRGSPPLHSGGQNQKWPTSGQSGYLTPAVSGIPTASQWGPKSEVAHKWAKWLPHPCRLGDPHRFRAGGKIRSGPLMGKMATSPLPYRDPHRFRAGGKIRSGPQAGKMATSPLPCRGSPPLQSRGQNQKWPTSGQSGYLTPAVSGIPTASERGAKSEVAHKWAKWLPRPCRIGDPHRFTAGGKIRSGTQVGKMATSPLPYRGSPPLHSGGQNQKWHTSGQSGYLTPAVSGIPTASERGAKSEVAHKWAKWLPHPCRIGDPHRFTAGGKSEVAHKWAKWLPRPCRIGDPHRFTAGGKIRSGPQVGKMATSPLPYRGSPPLHSGGQNQKWPTSGQNGYLTRAVSGIPTASQRGAKSEVTHKWAKWLPHPCRIGDPHRFIAGGKIRSDPQVGKMATSPLPYRRSPPLHSGGQNQKWPTSGQKGYLTLAASGIPTASEQGSKIRSGPQLDKVATSPVPYRDSHRFKAGGKIRSGPQVGKVATSPLPYRGSPPLQSGGQNQKWPTSGQNGYLTPAVSGIPTASGRGAKSEVAHKWAKWLPHPCRIGDPHRFRAVGKVRSGPQVGKMATSPLPYRGSPPLQGGGQNQKWPTSGQNGYLTPAVSGIPTASEQWAKSEVAHKWAKWLPYPCRIGDPHRFRAGGKIRGGPQVGKMATSPLPSRGSPPLQGGGQNQKWPTSGQNGYLTPAVSGIPTASEQWAKSEVAHKWAKWLPHPCRIGDPHRFRAGGKIRSGPQVGKMATSPLPYRGSPPLQSSGQSQKWPTSGQNGYLTPAVSRIPTASEQGGKIRSGPQVGKVATSPLPSRGSPPLQSGGQNQKWPTSGQNGYLPRAVSGISTA